MKGELKNSLKGVVPVQLCPYTREGEVDVEGIKENTKFIVDFAKDGNKDAALLTNGDTTEFYANSCCPNVERERPSEGCPGTLGAREYWNYPRLILSRSARVAGDSS